MHHLGFIVDCGGNMTSCCISHLFFHAVTIQLLARAFTSLSVPPSNVSSCSKSFMGVVLRCHDGVCQNMQTLTHISTGWYKGVVIHRSFQILSLLHGYYFDLFACHAVILQPLLCHIRTCFMVQCRYCNTGVTNIDYMSGVTHRFCWAERIRRINNKMCVFCGKALMQTDLGLNSVSHNTCRIAGRYYGCPYRRQSKT